MGWGGELSYEECHRGLSIFSTTKKAKCEAAKLEQKRERIKRANHVLPQDIVELDVGPPLCP
eukprot:2610798-Ditylum_brightwellii.AAC.1